MSLGEYARENVLREDVRKMFSGEDVTKGKSPQMRMDVMGHVLKGGCKENVLR